MGSEQESRGDQAASPTARCWSLYLVRCRLGTLYAGISTDVARRFAEHQQGGPKASRYLRGKGPLQLVYQCELGNRSTASRLERQVKRWSAREKQRLVHGEINLQSLLEESAGMQEPTNEVESA